ncbi:uncharacterized protein UTRI_06266 [Ustilago trichophora]|uniref:Uncharacterized protein n=1 Tax=Ustilago trichophora TaxID=86804 RepID=A0A5C3EHZ6_9BASI|nr:uncharacterized protein UTRI_06266 [Ustilago trichophora]
MSRNASSQPQPSRSPAHSDAASAAPSRNSTPRNHLFRATSPSSETRLPASTQPAPSSLSSSHRDRTASRQTQPDLDDAAARRARRQKRREEEAYQVKGWENLYGGGGGKPVFAHSKPAKRQHAESSSTASSSSAKPFANDTTISRDSSATTQAQSTSSKNGSSSSRSERASGSQLPPSTAPARSITSTEKPSGTKKRKAPSPSPPPSSRRARAATLHKQVIPKEQDSDDDFEVVGFSGPAAKRSRVETDTATVVKASPSPNPPPLKSSQPTQTALLRRSISRPPSTGPRGSPAAHSVHSENDKPPSASVSASASASASTSREPSQSRGSRASSASRKSGPSKLTPQDVEDLTKSAYDAFMQGVSLADHVANVVRLYSGLLSANHPDHPAVEQFGRKLTELGQQLTISDIRLATPTLPSRLAKRFAPVLSAYIKFLKQRRNAEQSNTTTTPPEASTSGTTATATAAAATGGKVASAVETATTTRIPAEHPAKTVQSLSPPVQATEASSRPDNVNEPASASKTAATSSGSAQVATVVSTLAHTAEQPRSASMESNTDAMDLDPPIDLGAQHDDIHDTTTEIAGAGRASTLGSTASPQAFGTPPEEPEELEQPEQPEQPVGAEAEVVAEAEQSRDVQHSTAPEEPEEEEEDELVDELADEQADEQVGEQGDNESALPNDGVEQSDAAQPTQAMNTPDATQTSADRPMMADGMATEKEQGMQPDQEPAKTPAADEVHASEQGSDQTAADHQAISEAVISTQTRAREQTDESDRADKDTSTKVHIQASEDPQIDKDQSTSKDGHGASVQVADTSEVVGNDQALDAEASGATISRTSTAAPVQEGENSATDEQEAGQSEQQTAQETEQQVEVQIEQEAEPQPQNEHTAEQRVTSQAEQQDEQQDQQQDQRQEQHEQRGEQQHQDAPGTHAEAEAQHIEQSPSETLQPATEYGSAGEPNENLTGDMRISEDSAVDQVPSAVNDRERALAPSADTQPDPQNIGTESNEAAKELAPGTSVAQTVQTSASTDETAFPSAAAAESPITTPPVASAPSAPPTTSLTEGDVAAQRSDWNANHHKQDATTSEQEFSAAVEAKRPQQASTAPPPSDLDATGEARASSLPITVQSEFTSLRSAAQDSIAEARAVPAVEAAVDQQQSAGLVGGRDAASEPPTSQAQAAAGPSRPAASLARVHRKPRTMDDRMKTLLGNLANAINRESSFDTMQKLKPIKVGHSTPQTVKDLAENWQDPAKMIPWDCLQEIGPDILHKNAHKYMNMSTHELMDRVSSKPAAKYLLGHVPERVMTRALMEFPRIPHMIHCWGEETVKCVEFFNFKGVCAAANNVGLASANVHEGSLKLDLSGTPTLAPSMIRTQSNPAAPSNAVPTIVPAVSSTVQQPQPHLPPHSISPAPSSIPTQRQLMEIGSHVLAAHIARQYQSAQFAAPPAQPPPVQQPLLVQTPQSIVYQNQQQTQQQQQQQQHDAAQAARWSTRATIAETLQRMMQQQQQQKQAEEQRKQAEKQRLLQVQERLRREAEEERRQREQQAEQLRLEQLEQQRFQQQQLEQQSAMRQAALIKQTVDGVFSGLVADCLSFAEHVIGSRGADEVTSRDHFSEADVLHVVNYVVGVYKRDVDSERSQGRENSRVEEGYARIVKLRAAVEKVISLTRTLFGVKMCLNEAVSESVRTRGVASTDGWLELLFTSERWRGIRDDLVRDESNRTGVGMLSVCERGMLLQRQIDVANKELESRLERMVEINVGVVGGDGGEDQEGEATLRNECYQIAGICCKHVVGVLGEAGMSS